ncbi:hypothetical protein HOF78_02610 [Candidatus Woesearchaeota archaeon]|jgi:hypothetical protein|nr:hypothetical protein [Candidatus Woesearchaeota archaeon]MBT6044932.1 hypothetical protein [Candidatus Woesearchaeota archaeon]
MTEIRVFNLQDLERTLRLGRAGVMEEFSSNGLADPEVIFQGAVSYEHTLGGNPDHTQIEYGDIRLKLKDIPLGAANQQRTYSFFELNLNSLSQEHPVGKEPYTFATRSPWELVNPLKNPNHSSRKVAEPWMNTEPFLFSRMLDTGHEFAWAPSEIRLYTRIPENMPK